MPPSIVKPQRRFFEIVSSSGSREHSLMIMEYHAKVWDQRIENDLEAGRLDAVLAEVEREYDALLA